MLHAFLQSLLSAFYSTDTAKIHNHFYLLFLEIREYTEREERMS